MYNLSNYNNLYDPPLSFLKSVCVFYVHWIYQFSYSYFLYPVFLFHFSYFKTVAYFFLFYLVTDTSVIIPTNSCRFVCKGWELVILFFKVILTVVNISLGSYKSWFWCQRLCMQTQAYRQFHIPDFSLDTYTRNSKSCLIGMHTTVGG